jgi:hypothetical protein
MPATAPAPALPHARPRAGTRARTQVRPRARPRVRLHSRACLRPRWGVDLREMVAPLYKTPVPRYHRNIGYCIQFSCMYALWDIEMHINHREIHLLTLRVILKTPDRPYMDPISTDHRQIII